MTEPVEHSKRLTTATMHQLAVRAIIAAYPRWDALQRDAAPDYTALHNQVHDAAVALQTLLERAAAHPKTY